MRTTLLVVAFSCALPGQDPRSLLENAAKAMGAADLKSIEYSGSGSAFTLGQSVNPNAPWPKVTLKSFTRTVDYANPGYSEESVRATPAGDQRVAQFVSGRHAWNMTGTNVTAAPAATAERLTQIWLTPHGFLKAAMANQATVKSQKRGGATVQAVSFTGHGKYKVIGHLGAQGTVDHVETWIENPLLGDMLVETEYSEYKDFGGVKFPARIVQKQGGHPTLDLLVTSVKPNAAAPLTVPAVVAQAAAAVSVNSEKIADGVWYLTGGSHHSVLVEFKDHVAVIEGPLNQERSKAIMAEVKKLVPAKPLRYLINTHHHFDHSGGVRAFAGEGVTIVTHAMNRPYYAKVFKGKFQTLTEKRIMTDGARTMELHLIKGNPHNDGILMAYLPKEKLLVEVDVYSPAPPNAPPPATPNPASVNLYENIERLRLDVERIVPLHGRIVPLAELKKAIGKGS